MCGCGNFRRIQITAFNRTILELKYYYSYLYNVISNAFNRTILELKSVGAEKMTVPPNSFNRTILELKSDI